MNAPAANPASLPAAEEYAQRLEDLLRLQARDRRVERALGISKLVVAALALIAAVFLLHHFFLAGLLAILVIAFVVLAIRHERLLQSIRTRSRVVDYYQRGLARLENRWAGNGESGGRFLDAAHPYARDLDIFGDASLFQYLCVARTRAGEETLAQWLLEPASIVETVARQAAVGKLRSGLSFRERLASAGETVRGGVNPEALAHWGEQAAILTSARTRLATTSLALLWILSIAAWAVWGSPLWAVLMSLLNFAYAHALHLRLEQAAGGIERASGDLRALAEALVLFEQESFPPGKLADLQRTLAIAGTTASRAVRKLARLADILESRHSLFARPFDLFLFWSAQLIFAAEKWQRRFGPSIRAWIAAVGELEALASLATFAYEHPGYAIPALVADGPLFEATNLAHPLLPLAGAVANDVLLGDTRRIMILSGPNMAGKSTFIRSLGVNAVLAQCGAPVCAHTLRMSPLRVAASICILDSLSGGVSRFYAEIRRIKLIVDLAGTSLPVLFLLDELLSGTNSHDRLIGTEFVLKSLADRNAVGIVSTHDLALTRIADEGEVRAFNTHFEDHIEDGQLIFDYKLKPGVVQTSNALNLMRAIGLGVNEPDARDLQP